MYCIRTLNPLGRWDNQFEYYFTHGLRTVWKTWQRKIGWIWWKLKLAHRLAEWKSHAEANNIRQQGIDSEVGYVGNFMLRKKLGRWILKPIVMRVNLWRLEPWVSGNELIDQEVNVAQQYVRTCTGSWINIFRLKTTQITMYTKNYVVKHLELTSIGNYLQNPELINILDGSHLCCQELTLKEDRK